MRIAKIKPFDVANGEGICVSVWTQGCHFRCRGCHNPETWSFNGGTEYKDEHKAEILRLLDYRVKKNLSILGGEPLCDENFDDILELCKFIKERRPETKINLWTGYNWKEITSSKRADILPLLDFLCVGRYIVEKKDVRLKFRGSTNQELIDVQATIKSGKLVKFDE